jgi:hypothetical protein
MEMMIVGDGDGNGRVLDGLKLEHEGLKEEAEWRTGRFGRMSSRRLKVTQSMAATSTSPSATIATLLRCPPLSLTSEKNEACLEALLSFFWCTS